MSDDLDDVKIKSYHHGALREALIAAGEAVLTERGLEGFSLRETARRAGVSAGAPAHHFGDTRGLLTAIAALAFRELTEELEMAAREPVPSDRVQKLATVYVQFAVRQRARFDLMWRSTLLDHENLDFRETRERAFRVFARAVPGVEKVEIPPDPVLAPSVALWSLAHGFARLAIDGAFGHGEEATNRAVETLLPAVLRSAAVTGPRKRPPKPL
jgi:AcrR family transcriptional regulator